MFPLMGNRIPSTFTTDERPWGKRVMAVLLQLRGLGERSSPCSLSFIASPSTETSLAAFKILHVEPPMPLGEFWWEVCLHPFLGSSSLSIVHPFHLLYSFIDEKRIVFVQRILRERRFKEFEKAQAQTLNMERSQCSHSEI